MKKSLLIFPVLLSLGSCMVQPDSNRDNDQTDPDKIYKLQLNPAAGSAYYYDIINESKIELEAGDKEIKNENKTTVGINCSISKDSAGNTLMNMIYEKIHLYTKSGDTETETDADNAKGSFDPVERMLGSLKGASIITTFSPSGELRNISGYEEIGNKLLAGFDPGDADGKAVAQNQWDKQIGNGLIKNTINQLFKIFPDSAVHIGDTWRLTSRQEGEITMLVKNSYTLKSINNHIAHIEARGIITSENIAATSTFLPGGATTDLKGEQQAEFEMETQTGMLINCRIKAKVEGTIHVLGREVPITIETSAKIKGERSLP